MQNLPPWLQTLLTPRNLIPEERRAMDVLAAIDSGGVPLDAALLNNIARRLGLEVLTTAPMNTTIERIRAELKRRGIVN